MAGTKRELNATMMLLSSKPGVQLTISLLLFFSLLFFFSNHPPSSQYLPSSISRFSLSYPYSNWQEPDSTLAYRRHLEQTTSPTSQTQHSPTLTFSHIYVLSLPTRHDRRDQISKLASALGLQVTFVDAEPKDAPFVTWIAERVVEVRERKIKLMAKARKINPASIGGLTIGTPWLALSQDLAGKLPFPSLDEEEESPSSWVDILEHHYDTKNLSALVPDNPKLNITEVLWDPLEKILGRQVNEGVISTFFGHTRAIKKILDNRDESALILEDDVDVEWDLERLWSRVHKRLPNDWDLTFLGHCWGKELINPAYLHPLLHESYSPLCLHGYALSSQGARRLLSLLNNPWTAYQTAVDTAVPTYINAKLLQSFSVDPPFVIQRKDGPSDIQLGVGSIWRGYLMDSTVERIAMDEGTWEGDQVWDPTRLDPATVFRYGKKKNC